MLLREAALDCIRRCQKLTMMPSFARIVYRKHAWWQAAISFQLRFESRWLVAIGSEDLSIGRQDNALQLNHWVGQFDVCFASAESLGGAV
jgi:hypothetical protein